MALERKQGPARAMAVVGNEYPDFLVPPIPEALKQRFPELETWRENIQENYKKLVDVLMRRDNETNSAIETVREEIP